MLLTPLCDVLKKQADERAFDVEEDTKKESSVDNGLSAVATLW